MNINELELTTKEKSLLLAKLTGRYIPKDPRPHIFSTHAWYFDDGIAPHGEPDLYDEANMALARKVFIWAICSEPIEGVTEVFMDKATEWLQKYSYYMLYDSTGFTRGLDKILELAIEAGLAAGGGVAGGREG